MRSVARFAASSAACGALFAAALLGLALFTDVSVPRDRGCEAPPPHARKNCGPRLKKQPRYLVLLLSSTRSSYLTFASFKANVLDALPGKVDIALSVGTVNASCPFVQTAKCALFLK